MASRTRKVANQRRRLPCFAAYMTIKFGTGHCNGYFVLTNHISKRQSWSTDGPANDILTQRSSVTQETVALLAVAVCDAETQAASSAIADVASISAPSSPRCKGDSAALQCVRTCCSPGLRMPIWAPGHLTLVEPAGNPFGTNGRPIAVPRVDHLGSLGRRSRVSGRSPLSSGPKARFGVAPLSEAGCF